MDVDVGAIRVVVVGAEEMLQDEEVAEEIASFVPFVLFVVDLVLVDLGELRAQGVEVEVEVVVEGRSATTVVAVVVAVVAEVAAAAVVVVVVVVVVPVSGVLVVMLA